EAADDVAFALSLGCASSDVGDGRFVELHPDDHGPVDGGVELPVTATVDAMTAAGHAGPGRDWTDASELRERCLGADALGVVAGDDEDLSRGIDPDAELLKELRSGHVDELLDRSAKFLDLCI